MGEDKSRPLGECFFEDVALEDFKFVGDRCVEDLVALVAALVPNGAGIPLYVARTPVDGVLVEKS